MTVECEPVVSCQAAGARTSEPAAPPTCPVFRSAHCSENLESLSRERVEEVFHDLGSVFFHDSPASEVPGPDPAGRDYASFARFCDPDGNGWVIQEVRQRAAGR